MRGWRPGAAWMRGVMGRSLGLMWTREAAQIAYCLQAVEQLTIQELVTEFAIEEKWSQEIGQPGK